ncbi:olfactory receptor 11A1-like [Stegastes partitus]|uniref:Olfactory receptor n=1 Tax=Stegastes partitus TaxID=144197 RepID=A0A9Y4NQ15_9TELE|nr:PREDICTED: olfactory receptor 11A1-like [Stegastes partitus]
MMNSTQVSHFVLAAYVDTGLLKYVYFLIVLCVYVFIVGANVFLIVVICVNRSLHEPMYMFLCSLFVNELYGSTGLFPLLLVQILSDLHSVPASLCFLQIFCVYSYGSVEFWSLALLSYDRYVAICDPLQYQTRMTPRRTGLLVLLTWFYPVVVNSVSVSLNSALQLCGNVITKVYCDHHAVVKLLCSAADAAVSNVSGLVVSFHFIVLPLALILFSYLRILQVCLSGCKQSRAKALSTCTPHLASLINFCFGACFEILQSRFDMSSVPPALRVFLSLYFLACPPVFNPLMYGLNLSRIRTSCKKLISQVVY